MAFEFLDHTADIKFRATGDTLSEALEQSAKALFAAIAPDSTIEPKTEYSYTVKIHLENVLVHDFLSELLYQFATEQMLFSEFELDLKESLGYKLEVTAKGEKYDPARHKLVKEVKAITYHDMLVVQKDGKWVIEVICDT